MNFFAQVLGLRVRELGPGVWSFGEGETHWHHARGEGFLNPKP